MLKFSALLACGLLAVAGCSSSNGGSGSPNVLEDVFDTVDPDQLAAATGSAAKATPRSGSVTQSANTGDTINVRVDGSGEYTITNTRGGSARWSVGRANVVDTDEGDLIFATTVGTGTVHVGLVVEPNIGGETDYLAYGLWAEVSAAGVPEIGVFMDSNDGARFDQNNLAALEGDATYRGQANGIYTDLVDEEGEISSFTGSVVLTAAFADATDLGTVTGTISSLRDIHDNVYSGETIDLGSATITDTGPGGFFTGATSSMVDIDGDGSDESFTGMWGGQFFVDGEADSDYPGNVAGTFGLANAGNTRSFLGLFRAQLDDGS